MFAQARNFTPIYELNCLLHRAFTVIMLVMDVRR